MPSKKHSSRRRNNSRSKVRSRKIRLQKRLSRKIHVVSYVYVRK